MQATDQPFTPSAVTVEALEAQLNAKYPWTETTTGEDVRRRPEVWIEMDEKWTLHGNEAANEVARAVVRYMCRKKKVVKVKGKGDKFVMDRLAEGLTQGPDLVFNTYTAQKEIRTVFHEFALRPILRPEGWLNFSDNGREAIRAKALIIIMNAFGQCDYDYDGLNEEEEEDGYEGLPAWYD